MTDDLAPGKLVRHPARPDWGVGQVQSVIGQRVTVNFEHAGKLLINIRHVTLEGVDETTPATAHGGADQRRKD